MAITINQTAIVNAPAVETIQPPPPIDADYAFLASRDYEREGLQHRLILAEYQLRLTQQELARELARKPLVALPAPVKQLTFMQRIGQALALSAPERERA